jgi:hypothetical protein
MEDSTLTGGISFREKGWCRLSKLYKGTELEGTGLSLPLPSKGKVEGLRVFCTYNCPRLASMKSVGEPCTATAAGRCCGVGRCSKSFSKVKGPALGKSHEERLGVMSRSSWLGSCSTIPASAAVTGSPRIQATGVPVWSKSSSANLVHSCAEWGGPYEASPEVSSVSLSAASPASGNDFRESTPEDMRLDCCLASRRSCAMMIARAR